MFRYAAYRHIRTRLKGSWPFLISGPRPYTQKYRPPPDALRPHGTPSDYNVPHEWPATYDSWSPVVREGRREKSLKALARYKTHKAGIEEEWAKIEAATGRYVLVIHNVSKALTEEDIMLLLPKGKHIEGWRGQGGLLKAIPGRDPITFRRLDFWVLLFSSSHYAWAYARELRRAHSIAKRHMPQTIDDPRAPIPGAQLEGEEDIPTILQEYTLLAPSQNLSINFESEEPVFPTWLDKLLQKSQEWSELTWNGRRVHPVRFCIEGAGNLLITSQIIRQMIDNDGLRRGMHWDVVLDDNSIVTLDPIQQKTMRVSEEVGGLKHHGAVNAPTINWMICFLDEAEARRFVRRWHGMAPRFAVSDGITRHMIVDADCLF